jgi:hypothetical protein
LSELQDREAALKRKNDEFLEDVLSGMDSEAEAFWREWFDRPRTTSSEQA